MSMACVSPRVCTSFSLRSLVSPSSLAYVSCTAAQQTSHMSRSIEHHNEGAFVCKSKYVCICIDRKWQQLCGDDDDDDGSCAYLSLIGNYTQFENAFSRFW